VASKNFWDLLTGKVDEVEVNGRGWQSPKGITCRAISVRTGAIAIEVGGVLVGQILLQRAVTAEARLALNAVDFGNFLSSALLRPLLQQLVVQGQPVTKLEVMQVNEAGVALNAQWQGVTYPLLLLPSADGKAVISGEPVLATPLENFFNNLTVDLQGLELTMASFALAQELLHLKADARVWKFPSAVLEF
jgi:hypothetical protein